MASSKEEYSEIISIDESDLTDVQRIIIEGFMREGEFTTRDAIVSKLELDVAQYLDEADDSPNMDWVDGVRYCIHIIKNGGF